MTSRGCLVAVVLSPAWLPAGVLRAAEPPDDFDTAVLRGNGVKTDGPSLVKFLSEWSEREPHAKRIAALVEGLGSDDFEERERASKQLESAGPPALEALRKAAKEGDAETVRRAQDCINEIEKGNDWEQRQRQLQATADALLRYLPAAADVEMAEDVWYTADDIVRAEGKVDAALVAALEDKEPARRALAACVVARAGSREPREAAKKLLTDREPVVRLRAAQGLLAGLDKSGLRALVELLGEPSVEVAWQAEELLRWAAGEEAPAEVVGRNTEGERKKCRAAWVKWLRERIDKADLARQMRDGPRPRLVVVSDYDDRGQGKWGARLWVTGCDGQPRYELFTERAVDPRRSLPHDRSMELRWGDTKGEKAGERGRAEGITLQATERPLRAAEPSVVREEESGGVRWRIMTSRMRRSAGPCAGAT